VEELIPALDTLLKEGDIVLVKASHFMGFDRIVEALK
jgi:UDP-N-acetylmuramyl pentapeptide synthase